MRLLRGVAGETLPCGCLVGIYETYEGDVITMVDALGAACPHPEHRLHAVLPTPPGSPDGPALHPTRS